jgi:hypothetical protein
MQCKILIFALNIKTPPLRVLNFKPYLKQQNIPSPSTSHPNLDETQKTKYQTKA